MNYNELKDLLTLAESENYKGRYEEANKLCNEVLILISSISSNEDNHIIEFHSRALRLVSECFWRRGMAKEAFPFAVESLAIAERTNNKIEIAKSIMNVGVVFYTQSDYTQALEYYTKALAINEEIDDKSAIAIITGNIGSVYLNLSEYQKALEFNFKALNTHEDTGNKAEGARVTGNIGAVYYYLSDFPSSLEYFTKALSLHEEMGNKLAIAEVTGNIGLVYSSIADYKQALEYMNRSLIAHEDIGNKGMIAGVKGNIGTIYFKLADYQRALEYMSKALSLHEELGNKTSLAIVTGNIGGVYEKTNDFSLALNYYVNALNIHKDIGNKTGIASVSVNIGNLHRIQLDNESALKYYFKSHADFVEIDDKVGIANVLGCIGSVYADKNYSKYDIKLAEDYLLKAIDLCKEIGIKEELFLDYLALANLYEELGNSSQALYHFKQYHNLEKEVQSEEIKKQAQRSAFERQIGEMQREQDVTERILHNILPKEIAIRIRRGDKKIVESFESVSVLFADIVGFTKLSQHVTPEELVAGLDGIFNTFDRLADKYGCEKIKTIGDCYMVVAGLPERCEDHAMRLASMSIDMLKAIKDFPSMLENVVINMRIGLHTGSVVAGIIGKNKYSYDLWGDAVNTASRMESHGEAGKIHVSEAFRNKIVSPFFQFTDRGEMEIKGKGKMTTYFLEQKNN